MYNLLRNCQTVFYGGYTILHTHQHCPRVPIYLHPLQYLLFSFIIKDILVDVKWYLIVVLICIPWWLTIWSIFFMFLLAICIPSLENAYPHYLAPFKLLFCSWVVWRWILHVNLARLWCPFVYSNTSLHVALKVFCRCDYHLQLALSKRYYPQ